MKVLVLFILLGISVNAQRPRRGGVSSDIDELGSDLSKVLQDIYDEADEGSDGGAIDELKEDLDEFKETQSDLVSSLTQKVNQLESELDELKDTVEGIVDEVLEKIKNSGIRLGNRWIIREEGTGSYEALVFRDLVSSGDTRYAMFKGRKTNL